MPTSERQTIDGFLVDARAHVMTTSNDARLGAMMAGANAIDWCNTVAARWDAETRRAFGAFAPLVAHLRPDARDPDASAPIDDPLMVMLYHYHTTAWRLFTYDAVRGASMAAPPARFRTMEPDMDALTAAMATGADAAADEMARELLGAWMRITAAALTGC